MCLQYLCCELADLQDGKVMKPLRVYDIAHIAWRMRVSGDLEAAMIKYKQVGRQSDSASARLVLCALYIVVLCIRGAGGCSSWHGVALHLPSIQLSCSLHGILGGEALVLCRDVLL
jgi:hypothetical protein